MIKPVSALQYGDLVFFDGDRWQVYGGTTGIKFLTPLSGDDAPISIDITDGSVPVYAQRQPCDHIPF